MAPPKSYRGDRVTHYRLLSGKGTMTQSWDRTFADGPCDPTLCGSPTVCGLVPANCMMSGSQTYKFRLERSSQFNRGAYLVKRRRGAKTLGAILIPVSATTYGNATGGGLADCVQDKQTVDPHGPNYFSLQGRGKRVRIIEQTTVFPAYGCVQAPRRIDMFNAGAWPTWDISRAKFRRRTFTLNLTAHQPFAVGNYRGTLTSHITMKLKRGPTATETVAVTEHS